ncbi:hypothetical protein [Hymenobacter agri]
MNGKMQLVIYVAEQAQYFLREIGELYPFAVFLNNEGEVKQLLLNWEEEKPAVKEYATALEAVVKVRLRFESILGGVICTDVLYRANSEAEKVDALQMKLLVADGTEHYYQPYSVVGQSVEFAAIVRDDMTFDRPSQLAE